MRRLAPRHLPSLAHSLWICSNPLVFHLPFAPSLQKGCRGSVHESWWCHHTRSAWFLTLCHPSFWTLRLSIRSLPCLHSQKSHPTPRAYSFRFTFSSPTLIFLPFLLFPPFLFLSLYFSSISCLANLLISAVPHLFQKKKKNTLSLVIKKKKKFNC